MSKPKEKINQDGGVTHHSVGAVIKKDNKYLLIDRAITPFGFAGVAGHIDDGESPEEALVREVKEEVNLGVRDKKLLVEKLLSWNECSKGIKGHYWYLFECDAIGEVRRSQRETKSVGWYDAEQIKRLSLEPAWEYWFKKLKII